MERDSGTRGYTRAPLRGLETRDVRCPARAHLGPVRRPHHLPRSRLARRRARPGGPDRPERRRQVEPAARDFGGARGRRGARGAPAPADDRLPAAGDRVHARPLAARRGERAAAAPRGRPAGTRRDRVEARRPRRVRRRAQARERALAPGRGPRALRKARRAAPHRASPRAAGTARSGPTR